jgi:O-antigen/teichoic acid export membrane protein
MLTGSYIGILHRFLIPVGMLYQLLWWMMLLQAAQYLSLMLAAFCQVSIIKAAVFSSIVQASVYLSSAIYIKKKLPQYFPWVKSPSGSIAMRDIIRSIPMSINGIMQQGGNSALIMLISAIISTAAVPAYATLRTLTNLGTTVANIVTAPLLPDIIRFHSIEDGKRLLMVHRAHILLISVVINIPILIFFPVINSIFEVWTKHKLILDHALLGCLLASVVIFSINSLFNTFLNGLNHKNYLIMSASIRGVLVFILGLVFMPYLHLKGLGIAILLAELVLLWINCQKFFKPELAKINCHNVSLFSKWNWLGYGAIFVFLIVDSMLTQINWYSYTITWVLCLTSIIFTWKELDIEIKIRLISLFKKPTKKAN